MIFKEWVTLVWKGDITAIETRASKCLKMGANSQSNEHLVTDIWQLDVALLSPTSKIQLSEANLFECKGGQVEEWL